MTTRFLAMLLFSASVLQAAAQCANDNVLYAVNATPPSCPGSITANCMFGGEYVLVNVVAGNTYTFSTCGGTAFDTQITIYNNTGGAALGYNDDFCGLQSTVTWVATFTGQLRVLVDEYPCLGNFSCANLTVTCTPPLVSSDCLYMLTLYDSFSDGWGTSYVGVSINGGAFQNYTLPSGSPSTSIPLPVNIGDVIVLNYNASGTWQTDNSYTLTLGGGILFNSGSPPAAGTVYAATVTCDPPPAVQEDCIGAMTICSNVSLNNNTNNTGAVVDISPSNSGCLDTQEYQGTWYVFSPSSGGNIGLTIQPDGPDDYDWGIWGPYPPGSTPASICPPAGPPIRCAASSGPATFNNTGSYATGMGHATFSPPQFAPTSTSYGLPSTTDICPEIAPQRCGWVPGMQVSTGQVYLMYISNWTQTNTGFSLSWNLQAGASLECVILGIDPLTFHAEARERRVSLNWSASETKPGRMYEVQRSANGSAFAVVGIMESAGVGSRQYAMIDEDVPQGTAIYRLKAIEEDGASRYSEERSVRIDANGTGLSLIPNPGQNEVMVKVPPAAVGGRLLLLDAIGRLVLQASMQETQVHLDAAALPQGVYAALVMDAAGHSIARSTWVKE